MPRKPPAPPSEPPTDPTTQSSPQSPQPPLSSLESLLQLSRDAKRYIDDNTPTDTSVFSRPQSATSVSDADVRQAVMELTLGARPADLCRRLGYSQSQQLARRIGFWMMKHAECCVALNPVDGCRVAKQAAEQAEQTEQARDESSDE